MSSREADPSLLTEDLEEFLERHGLDPSLKEPLEQLLARALDRGEGAKPVSILGGAGHTLMLAYGDATGPVPDTLPSLADPSTDDPFDVVPPEPSRALVRLGLLGRGGMAEVHRARDLSLDRVLAMKILHERFRSNGKMRARFLIEAQITAQLAHPSIPPVHAVGVEGDLPYFTMKQVHGRTLSEVIAELHDPLRPEGPWTETRLLDVFHKVCDAVAYAHARGVVHCDLKPSNVMVGAFGEVLVMDWGVARLVEPAQTRDSHEPRVQISWVSELHTADLAGTPAYMAPEQAGGEVDRVGPASDVYALGVMLFELLSGRRPYGGSPIQLLAASKRGEIPRLEGRSCSVVDETLIAIVHRAMAPRPEDRYPDAAGVAADIGRWREGSLRRERARAVAREAQALLPQVGPKRERARLLRDLAQQRLSLLGPDATAEEKTPAWALEDEAILLERQSELRILEVTQKLHGALAHAPDLREAHELLARIHFERHEDAERRRAWDEAAGHEVLLRAHDVGDYADYLAGVSTLTLVTEPPCEARLYRFVERGRQLARELVRELGRTPLGHVELPVGSYLIELDAGDRPVVRYPVQLRRADAWSGRPPGERATLPVRLPAAEAIAPDEVYVPAGWYLRGGDRDAPGAARSERVWVDGFVMKRHPVTAAELFRFLATPEGEGVRRGALRSDVSVFRPDWPACGVPWQGARAYAEWLSEQTGHPWRLPTEAEWEKAARGVDGRWFPWGDVLDGAFAHVRVGGRVPRSPRGVATLPHDCSPYGVFGLGGNVRDWCEDPWSPEGAPSVRDRRAVPVDYDGTVGQRAVRGGSWRLPGDAARAAARAGVNGQLGYADIGFRLVRSLDAW